MLQEIAIVGSQLTLALRKNKYSIDIRFTKQSYIFLLLLVQKRLIRNFIVTPYQRKGTYLTVFFFYLDNKISLLSDFKMYSTQKKYKYCSVAILKHINLCKNKKYSNLNVVFFIFTRKGLLTIDDAIKHNLGGILVCHLALY